jgi:hypothetical protein
MSESRGQKLWLKIASKNARMVSGSILEPPRRNESKSISGCRLYKASTQQQIRDYREKLLNETSEDYCMRLQSMLDYQADEMRKRSRTKREDQALFWSNSKTQQERSRRDTSPRTLTFY